VRRLGIVDESLTNNEGKTARDVESSIKEEIFRENIQKQK